MATSYRASAPRLALYLIVALYLVLGALYAWFTPLWQNPDEPAHFNYVRLLAETGHLPVLNEGDYDQAYLEEIKARHFPADMPVDVIRYEEHQPPLYYVLALPLYRLSGSGGVTVQVRVLRMLGVLLGLGVVLSIAAATRLLFAEHPWRAVLAAGFAALLPMHVAMMAAVNNDGLAEFFIVLGMVRLLLHVRQKDSETRAWVITGVVLGLGMISKAQAYILAPLAGAVWLWQVRAGRDVGASLRGGLGALLAALAIAAPWWWRNTLVYGPGDWLGLHNHELIVTGQPRTAAWIAANGWGSYLHRLFTFTFESFWGVFGWLGVFMDSRIYQALLVFTVVVLVGACWHIRMMWPKLTAFQRRGLALLGLQALGVLASYVWYNLDFVQHQGRYLFPALLPLAVGVALGLEGALSAGGSRRVALVCGLGLLGVVAWGLGQGDVAGWLALALAVAGAGAAVRARWQAVPAWVLGVSVLLLLGLVALWALFGAIVPQLG